MKPNGEKSLICVPPHAATPSTASLIKIHPDLYDFGKLIQTSEYFPRVEYVTERRQALFAEQPCTNFTCIALSPVTILWTNLLYAFGGPVTIASRL